MTDPIADMLTRIRNAQAVEKETVDIPFSKMKFAIAQVLERRGFIKKIDLKGRKVKRMIELTLKYKDSEPRIEGLKRVSKSGQRVYISMKGIHKVKGGLGISILSTSKGLMTDRDARAQNLGGEILCEIW